jgi:hypothetical protein
VTAVHFVGPNGYHPDGSIATTAAIGTTDAAIATARSVRSTDVHD